MKRNKIKNDLDWIRTPEDPYYALANAIIKRAEEDYRKVCKEIKKYPDDKKLKKQFNDLVVFFKSPYCDSLTKLDPVEILNRLDDEIWG